MPTALPMRAPEKAKFGEPCSNCGICCSSELCAVGKALHGQSHPAPCPSMEWGDGRFWCGAVRMADEIGPMQGMFLRMKLGIGVGCDSDDPEPRGK